MKKSSLLFLFTVIFISFYGTLKVQAEVASGTEADIVIGQPNMTSSSANQGGSTAANTLAYDTNVYSSGSKLFVTDPGNSRVLIYNSIPTSDNASADVVIGQPNMTSHDENQGIPVAANTLYEPMSMYSNGTKLFIVDKENNRVLIFNSIPTSNNASADVVIGQPNMVSNSYNQGGAAGVNTLAAPQGVCSDGTKLFIADWNNSRVLIYNSIPTSDNASADVVIGQPNMTSRDENQGGPVAANTLSGPTGVYFKNSKLFIVDQANHRILIYNSIPTSNNASADVVVGQPNMASSDQNQGGSVAANTLNYPINVYSDGTKLFITDSSNNRVLIYNSIPTSNNASADEVIGQANFISNGENQGLSHAYSSTLKGPGGISTDNSYLYVSDFGNNRILMFPYTPSDNIEGSGKHHHHHSNKYHSYDTPLNKKRYHSVKSIRMIDPEKYYAMKVIYQKYKYAGERALVGLDYNTLETFRTYRGFIYYELFLSHQ